MQRARSGLRCSAGTSSETTVFTASSVPPASGTSACNWRRTTVPPEWPDGVPQQVHLDLHVENPRAAHEVAVGLGARLLQPGDFDAEEGHQVYADPAGHPFCIGWRHPSRESIAAFVADRLSAEGADSGRG
ncbi:MAG: VOC family protein [Acidimicrobiales bacterium]